ncbi:hypothetical protein PMAYCL1PPCAC_32355, partial [Pristionchus mayeri]
ALVVEEDGVEELRDERIHHRLQSICVGHPRRQQHENLAFNAAHLTNDRIREHVLTALLHSVAHFLRVDTVDGKEGIVDVRQLVRELHADRLAHGDVRLEDVEQLAEDL